MDTARSRLALAAPAFFFRCILSAANSQSARRNLFYLCYPHPEKSLRLPAFLKTGISSPDSNQRFEWGFAPVTRHTIEGAAE
jgi:hypothetical protein